MNYVIIKQIKIEAANEIEALQNMDTKGQVLSVNIQVRPNPTPAAAQGAPTPQPR